MAIKVVVDSASDISKQEAEEMGITMIPIIVRFGQDDYYDGVDLLPNDFYEKLVSSNQLPKTSQITPFRFEEEFERLTANGDEVIVITLSSKLSGTYASALQAAERFENKVYVIDTLNASIGERLLCMRALDLINEGKNIKEIVEYLNNIKSKIKVMAMLNTLEYLKKGGRISSVVAFAGEMFSLKPIVAMVDGEVKLVGKARGSRNGKNLLNSLVEKTGINYDMPVGIIYAGNDRTMVETYISDSTYMLENAMDVNTYIIGSTIGTHVGPGAIGIAFFEK